jgi:DNA polymerase III gamma/tau subunit
LSPEAIEIVLSQAERIDRGRLLDLIERCAEGEQRMKWAPNKKMHLEIAVIRAIQTLSQATLGEVLDTLGSMREGGPVSAPAQPKAQPEKPKPTVRNAVAAPGAPAAESTAPKPPPVAAPVAVEASVPMTAVIAEPPQIVPADVVELWSAVIQRVRKERPLLASNVEATVLLEIKADSATVGVDSMDMLSLDLLDSPNNRKFLERLLTEAAGQPLTIKFAKREGLVATPPPREPEPRRRSRKTRCRNSKTTR